MATTQKVVADLGSDVATLVRLEVNKLVDAVEGLQTAAIASADASDLPTAITLVNEIKVALNAVAAVDLSALKKYVATLELASAPAFPAV